jgi:diketogulonate reductase-like aldo/keto reductase
VTGRKGKGPLEDATGRATLRKNNPQYFPHLTGSFEITRIARLHSRTAAQVILAWIIGRGVCVIPKSNSRTRLAENFDVLFRLTAEEDAEIGNLMGPRGERAVRNLDSRHHIGFDCYDEESDQPVPI